LENDKQPSLNSTPALGFGVVIGMSNAEGAEPFRIESSLEHVKSLYVVLLDFIITILITLEHNTESY